MAKKAIIVPRGRDDEWPTGLFPKYSVAEVPFVGKALVEYQLDALARRGFTDVLVLDRDYSHSLHGLLLGDGRHRWPLALDYRETHHLYSNADEVLAANAEFTAGAETEVVIGMMFPRGDSWRAIVDVREFYEFNFELLASPLEHTLEGYSGEEGEHIGANVVIKTGRRLEKPVFLGDNSRLEYAVTLLDGAIVSRGAIVDTGTVLSRAIIFPNTYVGRNAEFARKIVVGSRVIDPDSGVYVDLADAGLASGVNVFDTPGGFSFLEWTAVALLAIVFLPFYLLWFLVKIPYRALRAVFRRGGGRRG